MQGKDVVSENSSLKSFIFPNATGDFDERVEFCCKALERKGQQEQGAFHAFPLSESCHCSIPPFIEATDVHIDKGRM